MKYLEYTPLDSISSFLSHVNLGECILKGNLEAYSCKHTGMDKKLSLSLEKEFLDCLAESPGSFSSSPSLSSKDGRKTLIYLVLTLNHMYPDYDFSAVQAHHFVREDALDNFELKFNSYMLEAARVSFLPHFVFLEPFVSIMSPCCVVIKFDCNHFFNDHKRPRGVYVNEWASINGESSLLESTLRAIDEVINLEECEVYSYYPDFEEDPSLEKGAIWSFYFFFYNKKLKRVVSFRCACLSKLVMDDDQFVDEMQMNDDWDIFDGMDM